MSDASEKPAFDFAVLADGWRQLLSNLKRDETEACYLAKDEVRQIARALRLAALVEMYAGMDEDVPVRRVARNILALEKDER